MASSNTVRTRSERVASLQLEPSALRRQLSQLLTAESLIQLSIALASAILITIVFQGWVPPFAYREGQIPDRDIVARVAFDIVDAQQTKLLRDQKRRETLCFYENRPQAIAQLRSALQNQIFGLLGNQTFENLTKEQLNTLRLLTDDGTDEPAITEEAALTHIRNLLPDSEQLNRFGPALQKVLNPISDVGVLKSLGHDSDQGNQRSIMVTVGAPNDQVFVDVSAVRHADIVASLPIKISEVFQQSYVGPETAIVAKLVSNYLVRELPETLTYRSDLSEKARNTAEASVPEARVSYFPTISKLAIAGQPISRVTHLPLLREEYKAWVSQLTTGKTISHLLAFIGVLLGLFVFCGVYIFYQYDSQMLTDPISLLRLLGLVVVTCLFCKLTASDPMRAELVPILVSVIAMTITFGRQVAILIVTCLSLLTTLALGLDIVEFITLCTGSCAMALFVGRIRTRTKLIYVGLATGAIVFLIHMCLDTVVGRFNALALDSQSNSGFMTTLQLITVESARLAGFAVLASALVAWLLPLIEKTFGVQTDLSLLELGDASHALLRQLAQRAPGTYNHSINVAAIAEAAADSIGAHGLLTRVGAYFHDIGKMFKPNYFVENQDQGNNCHDTLQPAMSTLVIIAHIKDGADLARQHHLPQPIVDFIEQHHGTTLVEYFYREATKRSQDDPNKEEVSETSFRYPGPKPQSLEAAVLMLADSVESASRTLVEPTASRLQNLVDKIAMNKLLDGQFDECGLTLQQLDQVKNSLVKSLTAIYHGRIKYGGQASA
jgi:cyclic-di-AMP phosphodiesterase PgpH